MKPYIRPSLIIFFVLLADQCVKLWIKTHMFIGQEYHVFGNWFLIHFTENNGMAFGMELEGSSGKLFLSLFRIFAVIGIAWYLIKLIRSKANAGLITCMSLIFAGAIGNIIDSVFYGKIFGYERLLHGRVVDMFYFPIIQSTFPKWVPVWGGQDFEFFRPVFNLADSAISIGVIAILLFQKRYFREEEKVAAE